jgi:ion channel POLLUX/CASTOR
LGDETHPIRKVIYTFMVVLGMATFVGALVATITQWLNEHIKKLEQGTTPVPWSGHILVLGWTTRTPFMLRELLSANDRVKRYLLGFSLKKLKICILTESVETNMIQTLQSEVGGSFGSISIVLRTGDPLNPIELERGAFSRAGIVMLPADRHESNEADQDAQTISIAMTMGALLGNNEHKPLLVAEMQNPKRAELLEALYPGQTVVVAADDTLSECAAQCVAQSGVSPLLQSILNQSTDIGLYLKLDHQCAGMTIQQADSAIPGGVLIGLLRKTADKHVDCILCPKNNEILQANDNLIFISKGLKYLGEKKGPTTLSASEPKHSNLNEHLLLELKPYINDPHHHPERTTHKVLITGWNRRTPTLMATLIDCHISQKEIINISAISKTIRSKACSGHGLNTEKIEFMEADSTQPNIWEDSAMTYDIVIVQASERYLNARDADAATLSVLAVARAANRHRKNIRYLVELLELDLSVLNGMDDVEPLPTSQFMAHMLAQAALRPELMHVYHSFFDPEKFQMTLIPLKNMPNMVKACSFKALSHFFSASGKRVLGLVRAENAELILSNHDHTVDIDPKDALLLLQPVL